MPGPHRKMVTQEESSTLSEGEGDGVARESGRAERVGAETGACGVHKVGAPSNSDSIHEPDGGPMLPEELRPVPGEGVLR